MKEPDLYPEIRKAFLDVGAAYSKIPGSTYNQGLPDCICTYRGKPVHCEVKIVTDKRVGVITELQRAHLERHNAAGALCFTLTYHVGDKVWRAETVVCSPGTPTHYVAARGELYRMLCEVLHEGGE